jgi:hypothetical protein
LVDKMTRWQWLNVGFVPPLKEGISWWCQSLTT